ncbi:hypothetical protein [Novosphingobium sp.]|uniref:hypothetical protein n=1 Tax=Novosphingobium sp. TaxID=1874826 RepID=UPI00262A2CD1|nr:hypothetical protein [Novosphingobium sp.]
MKASIKLVLVCAAAGLGVLTTSPVLAQSLPSSAPRPKDVPAKIESYYRVRWGSLKDFVALYEKNHKPLLEEMRKEGFILAMKTEYPFTHIAGGPRWDVRVTITYRDGAAAINDPAWETRWAEARKRLFKDAALLDEEEAKRFSLLEDHWDVVVSDYPE